MESSRKLKITSEVRGFKDPADKRAIAFLYESKFDIEDLESLLKPALYRDMDKNIRVKPAKTLSEADVDK